MVAIGKADWTNSNKIKERKVYKGAIPAPNKMPSIEKILKGKKNEKTKQIYYLLLFRSIQNNGDTKISNERLAQIVGQSKRSVIRHINKLKKLNLLITHTKLHRIHRDDGNFDWRTERIFTVWLGLAANGYRQITSDYVRFSNDIRQDLTKAIRKVPMKWRIREEKVYFNKKLNKFFEVKPIRYTLHDAAEDGTISAKAFEQYCKLIYNRSAGDGSALNIMGYDTPDYHRLKHKIFKNKEQLKKIS